MASTASSSSFFQRWATLVVRRRWPVVGISAVLLATVFTLSALFGGSFVTKFSIPGSESQHAQDLLKERFPQQGGASARLVFSADAGVADPAIKQRITDILAQAAALPGVSETSSPYDQSTAISKDGRTAFAAVEFPKDDSVTRVPQESS